MHVDRDAIFMNIFVAFYKLYIHQSSRENQAISRLTALCVSQKTFSNSPVSPIASAQCTLTVLHKVVDGLGPEATHWDHQHQRPERQDFNQAGRHPHNPWRASESNTDAQGPESHLRWPPHHWQVSRLLNSTCHRGLSPSGPKCSRCWVSCFCKIDFPCVSWSTLRICYWRDKNAWPLLSTGLELKALLTQCAACL